MELQHGALAYLELPCRCNHDHQAGWPARSSAAFFFCLSHSHISLAHSELTCLYLSFTHSGTKGESYLSPTTFAPYLSRCAYLRFTNCSEYDAQLYAFAGHRSALRCAVRRS